MFKDANAFSGFSVDNIDKAKQFYGEILGLQLNEQPGMGFGFSFPNGHTVFVYSKPDHQPATFTVLNFPVGNIDVAIDELTNKGIKMIQYSNPKMPQDERGVMRGRAANMGPDIAWFSDPAGNILAVLQEK